MTSVNFHIGATLRPGKGRGAAQRALLAQPVAIKRASNCLARMENGAESGQSRVGGVQSTIKKFAAPAGEQDIKINVKK